jgi:hypothetical protein
MDIPNLNRIIDTYIPITSLDLSAYLQQLRSQVLPEIRNLERTSAIRWYAFLIHDASQLGGREPMDGRPFIHLRLEPASSLDPKSFIRTLPSHFLNPIVTEYSSIAGLDGSILTGADWAQAWKIHGECSSWILNLIEGHAGDIPVKQIVQFLHFITNPLTFGNRCLFIPSGYFPF